MVLKHGQCAKQTVTGSSLFTCRHCVVSLVSDGMTRYPTQKSMRERNYQTLIADRRHSLFGHMCRLPENTPASQALQLSIEAHTSTPPATDWKHPPSSTKKLAATSGRRHCPICWCCPDRGPGSFDVEDAMTLSWSSAAVSE